MTPSKIEEIAMTDFAATPPVAESRLRLWPGLVIVLIMWACLKIPGYVIPGEPAQFYFVFFGPMVLTIVFLVWWVFFSKARWADRGLAVAVAALIGVGAFFTYDPTLGFMGVVMSSLPLVLTAWVGWLLLSAPLTTGVRKAGFVVAVMLAWLYPSLLRFDGVTGGFAAQISYRWEPTNEDLFLKEAANRQAPGAIGSEVSAVALRVGDWPSFRGPERNSQLPGVRIATDWKQNAPKLLWKQRIGPGWSSFAVLGNHLYTQEQRGEEELVVCYDAETGKEIWNHQDHDRFSETAAGAGPRATPTFYEGKIYALGAKGRFNCLDAATGKLLWTRDIVADSGRNVGTDPDTKKKIDPVPIWGYSSSPLVVKGLVTVFAGGPKDKSVLAYKVDTGEPAWAAGEGSVSYSSTQLSKVNGVDTLLITTDKGVSALKPETGEVAWKYDWEKEGMPRCTQPQLVGSSDILIGTVDEGMRRIHISNTDSAAGATSDAWATRAIKPYFSDFVVHKGHIYGFDGIFFNCVNASDGKLKWKARGYDSGQVLLFPDQDLLLILSEKGEAALVEAKPDAHHELCKIPMIEGKTWNHPVFAHGKLFVRNDKEAACYQLNEETAKTQHK
jgi:outer membrane protein assembly factor BamB